MTENYPLAIVDFKEAILLKPDYAEAFVNKGNAELNLNMIKEALTDFNKSILFNPDLASAFYYRGVTNAKLNKNSDACDDFKKACSLGIDAQNETMKYCK
jgi:tetratricopeptide (TPR) repeat protein